MGNLTNQSIRINSVVDADRLILQPSAGRSGSFEIMDTRSGQCLGTVTQAPGSAHEVELFFGKGGFMAMITSPQGAQYFALPGSSLSLPGLSLVLEGCAITTNPGKASATQRPFQPQAHSQQATILGAGLATRFERISGDSTQYSKPAVPLAGKCSVIACIANSLVAHGFSRLVVNTYFKPVSLKASLNQTPARQIAYIDEDQPSGTAGGLRKMLLDPKHQGLLNLEQPLLVVQGDAVTDASFSDLMNAHVAQNALITIGCQEVAAKDVDKFGIIVTDRSGSDGLSGRITGFQEKPKAEEALSRLGNTGFYILSPKAFPLVQRIYSELLEKAQTQAKAQGQSVPAEVPFDFAMDLFPAILKLTQDDPSVGAFWAQAVDGYWSDIGNPVQYLESIHDLYAGKVNIPLPEAAHQYYRDGVIFWDGAQRIADDEQAQLQGNIVVALPFKPEVQTV